MILRSVYIQKMLPIKEMDQRNVFFFCFKHKKKKKQISTVKSYIYFIASVAYLLACLPAVATSILVLKTLHTTCLAIKQKQKQQK